MLEHLPYSPIIPVFYHADLAYAQQIVSACHAGGLRFFEFTNRGDAAFEVFSGLKKYAETHCPGLQLGIGTIYSAEDARRFADAGADFVVQPVTSEAVGAVCRASGIPWIPGAMTLNEVWTAWQLGATVVKIFPGSVLGPGFIRALRGPMPQVPLMVTGGVEPVPENIREWLAAGVQAVGIGSQLFGGNRVGDFSGLSEKIAQLLAKTIESNHE